MTIASNAQIGVYTEKPQGVFHLDTNKDNDSGAGSSTDDIVITNSGYVGIGTVTPSARLDVRGTLRLQDGTQANGKVLVCDASGNASWGAEPYPPVVYPNQNVATQLSARPISNIMYSVPKYMGISITLPAGTWQVTFICTHLNPSTNTRRSTIWWDLARGGGGTSHNLDGGRVLSTAAIPGGHMSTTATYFVSHKTTTTYYIWAGNNSGQNNTYFGHAAMWAIPVS
ncbi:hypothetical protein D0T56_08105 [Dysgonomonas sp. 520]|nr:hypothetical protein [Dysgonomonas sp. 520]